MRFGKQVIGVLLVLVSGGMLFCITQTPTLALVEFVIWLVGAIFVIIGMYQKNAVTATNVLAPWKFYHDYYWGISVSLLASGFTILLLDHDKAIGAWITITIGAVFLGAGAYFRGKIDRFHDSTNEGLLLRQKREHTKRPRTKSN